MLRISWRVLSLIVEIVTAIFNSRWYSRKIFLKILKAISGNRIYMFWSLLKPTISSERIQYTVLLTFVQEHQYLKLYTSHVWMFTPLVNSIALAASMDFKRRQMIPGLHRWSFSPRRTHRKASGYLQWFLLSAKSRVSWKMARQVMCFLSLENTDLQTASEEGILLCKKVKKTDLCSRETSYFYILEKSSLEE